MAEEKKILRWDLSARAQHIHLLVSAAFLLVSGAALFAYKVPNFGWLATMLGGVAAARIIHRVFAALLVGLMVMHLFISVFTKKLRSKVWPSGKDIGGFFRQAVYEFGGGKPSKEVLGFHSPIDKFDYWVAAVIGLLWMAGTGAILWAPQLFPWVPVPLAWILVLHDLGFILAGVYLVLHVYFTAVARPEVADAMFGDGQVPVSYVREEHPGWYEELKKS